MTWVWLPMTRGLPRAEDLASRFGLGDGTGDPDALAVTLWDETITFHPDGRITRKLSPSDDEDYSAASTWTGADWAAVD